MNYKQAIAYIDSLEYIGTKLGLSRIRRLLKLIGNPEGKLRVIHVAGTNGKGSVSSMTASILKEAGYKAGLYTSPHFVHYRERFVINGRQISKNEFAKYVEKLKPLAKKTNVTLFEFITALAFLYYKDNAVDFLILETGLGGRLDATNVVKSVVAVITNISIEHTEHLGNSISTIAREKAGIIKQGSAVVTGARGSSLNVIRAVCKQRNAKLILSKKSKTHYSLSLEGSFQEENANTVLTVIDLLKNHYNIIIPNKSIKAGLKNTLFPGRFEFVKKNRKQFLLDAAHNPAAFKQIAIELGQLKKKYAKIIPVLCIMKDKNYRLMTGIISKVADKIIITAIKNERAARPEEMAEAVPEQKEAIIVPEARKAILYASKIAGKKDLIVVTGSMYYLGELKKGGIFK